MSGPTSGNTHSPRNERGVIAEHYAQLQAIPILNAAKIAHPLPKASEESSLRAVFQCAEIALINISDLVMRAAHDIDVGDFGAAVVKLSWERGFHFVLVGLSTIPDALGLAHADGHIHGTLKISESPAAKNCLTALRYFDETLLRCMRSGVLDASALLENNSLDNVPLRILHLARLCDHETTIWERNLLNVAVTSEVSNYDMFVATKSLQDAVYDLELEGDTFFKQFRGLHQIPEVLCAEVNDHIEEAIRALREGQSLTQEGNAGSLRSAYDHVHAVNALSKGIVASLVPMADQLTTADYHRIRENLGLTSGSHSVNIHFHLFRDLYSQLCVEFEAVLSPSQNDGVEEGGTATETLRTLDKRHLTSARGFLVHILANELQEIRGFINLWRDEHLHLPRNNVGGGNTKSLTGSPDAIQAVKHMREAALTRDPLQFLLDARGVTIPATSPSMTPLTTYVESASSLDHELLEKTGAITKRRFQHVQDRTGVFANKPPFSPPPRRRA